MPPAYPAPSPVGYRPFNVAHSKVSLFLVICTGALVRVSTPCRMASKWMVWGDEERKEDVRIREKKERWKVRNDRKR